MGFLHEDREFFRYLVSKIIQTNPSSDTSEVYAENVFQRAVKVFDKIKEYEKFRLSNTQSFELKDK